MVYIVQIYCFMVTTAVSMLTTTMLSLLRIRAGTFAGTVHGDPMLRADRELATGRGRAERAGGMLHSHAGPFLDTANQLFPAHHPNDVLNLLCCVDNCTVCISAA